jgi:small multidrug resistance pump
MALPAFCRRFHGPVCLFPLEPVVFQTMKPRRTFQQLVMNPNVQSWLFLLGAILMEVSGTTCLKLSEQFTRLWPSLLMFCFYGLSLAGLNFALKAIDLSVAYAVWSALGITLVSVIGMSWFREPISALKIACLLLVVVGVVGLQLAGSNPP